MELGYSDNTSQSRAENRYILDYCELWGLK